MNSNDERDYAEEAANRDEMGREGRAELEAERGIGATCPNNWHRTAPARMHQKCPECPSEVRTAILEKLGTSEEGLAGFLTVHATGEGYYWLRSDADDNRTGGIAEKGPEGWKVLTDAEQSQAVLRAAADQRSLELNHQRIQRELGLVRALVLAKLDLTEAGIRQAGETLGVDDAGEGWFAWGYQGNETSLWGTVQDGPDGWEVAKDADCI